MHIAAQERGLAVAMVEKRLLVTRSLWALHAQRFDVWFKGGCQRDVGHWGDDADASQDYDGGHLLGHQLGGWRGRANLVPQLANVNRGQWLAVENTIARCDVLADGQLRMVAEVEYPDKIELIPTRFRLELVARTTDDSIALTFDNPPHGGAAGSIERLRAVEWLQALGGVE